ncbi:MAG: hypothetical protein H0V81_05550, partial [Solirubrobacterales bacterium]|nr:hypothetical protein [Solirubrobacterales bacterium]
AKATRGDVARLLVGTPDAPRDPEAVAATVEAGGLRVELGGSGARWQLDVVLS